MGRATDTKEEHIAKLGALVEGLKSCEVTVDKITGSKTEWVCMCHSKGEHDVIGEFASEFVWWFTFVDENSLKLINVTEFLDSKYTSDQLAKLKKV